MPAPRRSSLSMVEPKHSQPSHSKSNIPRRPGPMRCRSEYSHSTRKTSLSDRSSCSAEEMPWPNIADLGYEDMSMEPRDAEVDASSKSISDSTNTSQTTDGAASLSRSLSHSGNSERRCPPSRSQSHDETRSGRSGDGPNKKPMRISGTVLGDNELWEVLKTPSGGRKKRVSAATPKKQRPSRKLSRDSTKSCSTPGKANKFQVPRSGSSSSSKAYPTTPSSGSRPALPFKTTQTPKSVGSSSRVLHAVARRMSSSQQEHTISPNDKERSLQDSMPSPKDKNHPSLEEDWKSLMDKLLAMAPSQQHTQGAPVQSWTCQCGYTLELAMKYCGKCGTPRNWTCGDCQFDRNLCDFSFCGNCGSKREQHLDASVESYH